jgi:hypothetical protein
MWQLRIGGAETKYNQPTPQLGVSWTIMQQTPQHPESWWTTGHIILAAVVCAFGLAVILVLIGAAIWLVKRRSSYDTI